MPNRTDWVSATDIGTYAYCGRMYWLGRVKNQKADKAATARLAAGHENHENHAKGVGRFTTARKHASEAIWYSGIGTVTMWLGVRAGLSERSIWIDLGLAAVAMALAFALRYASMARKLAREARIPEDVKIVASDTAASRGKTLRDPGRGLYGRPDYILEEVADGHKKLVPVEIKPTKKSTRLFESDEAQLALYMIVLEHLEPMRAAGYGRVVYSQATFQVTLSDRLRKRVMELAENVREARKSDGVNRTHNIIGRCTGCSLREQCDQVLEPRARKRGKQ